MKITASRVMRMSTERPEACMVHIVAFDDVSLMVAETVEAFQTRSVVCEQP